MTNHQQALHALQEMLDYWISEGGTYPFLREHAEQAINRWIEALETQREDYKWMSEVFIPYMKVLADGIQAIEVEFEMQKGSKVEEVEEEIVPLDAGHMSIYDDAHEHGETTEETTVASLDADYELYGKYYVSCGREIPDAGAYIEEYCRMHENPPKGVAAQFLRRYYPPSKVAEILAQIAWPEDEFQEDEDFDRRIDEAYVVEDAITWIRKQGQLAEVQDIVMEVREEFLKIDWEWYGLQHLCDEGTLDEKMYYRMWLAIRDQLCWEIDYEHHVEILQGIEDTMKDQA